MDSSDVRLGCWKISIGYLATGSTTPVSFDNNEGVAIVERRGEAIEVEVIQNRGRCKWKMGEKGFEDQSGWWGDPMRNSEVGEHWPTLRLR